MPENITEEGDGSKDNEEKSNKPASSPAYNPASKCMDDMSMFLAWQNWCWMHYSWSVYQKSMLQATNNMRMMTTMMQQQQQQQQPATTSPPTTSNTPASPNQNQPQPTAVFKLASIQKRICAESIDFLLLAFVKVFVIFMMYGDEYVEHFNFILIIDEKTSYDDIHWMFVQTLLFRLVVIAYEGYMLSNTLPFSHGWTLGKHVMNIKVIYASEVVDENLAEQTVRVTPKPLGAVRSCCRSILKNMSISFLFPMFLPIIMFTNNRLIYDMSVGSLVVEKQPRNGNR